MEEAKVDSLVDKPLWTEQEVKQIIKLSRGYLNVPWRHQGRSKISGVDCVGIFSCVADELGRPIEIPSNYTHDPDPKILMQHMEKYFDKVLKSEMHVGDFVLMRFPDGRRRMPNRHVGLLTNIGLLHSGAEARKVVEHTLNDEWYDRIEHVYRLRRYPL